MSVRAAPVGVFFFMVAVLGCAARAGLALTAHVSTAGLDANPGTRSAPWRTIQKAADSARPGTTVLVESGVYHEKVKVRVSGSADEGFVTFQADGDVIISGEGENGANIVYLKGNRYVRIIGFEIRDNLDVNTGAGIWIDDTGEHLELRDNRIHNIRGRDAMGIAVYGRSPASPIADLVIHGNEVFDCDPARSEAITLNGNVTRFLVMENSVHDVNNIGIDFIGGEGTCPDPEQDAARDGICSGNRVWNARSSYGGGYAAGIYVDGGRNIILERNVVTECDLGIEVGAENAGFAALGVVVRNNFVHANDKAGIIFGGYEAGVGRVRDCQFLNNTCINNDTLRVGNGELAIQFAERNTVENNIFHSGGQNVLMNVQPGGTNNYLDYNLWFSKSGESAAVFTWGRSALRGLARFRSGSGQGTHSLFSDPQFAGSDRADFHLDAASPAIDRGDGPVSVWDAGADFDGEPRPGGFRIDIGADEVTPLQVESVRDGIVRVSWPASFTGYALEKAGALFDGTWLAVSPTETSFRGARKVVEEKADGDAQFYRIRKN